MMFSDNSAMLSTLGYTRLWYDNGLLTHNLLVAQLNAFATDDNKHTEHYRYGAFKHYLTSRTHLTDEELAGYLQVALAEQDSIMGGSAVKDLFTEINLTDQQFAEVCKKLDEFLGEWTATIRTRQQLLRQLLTGRLDALLFEQCLTNGDSVVQKKLLEVADTAQLAELATKGKTRTIRNMAVEKINNRLQ